MFFLASFLHPGLVSSPAAPTPSTSAAAPSLRVPSSRSSTSSSHAPTRQRRSRWGPLGASRAGAGGWWGRRARAGRARCVCFHALFSAAPRTTAWTSCFRQPVGLVPPAPPLAPLTAALWWLAFTACPFTALRIPCPPSPLVLSSPPQDAFYRQGLPNIMQLLATVAIFLMVVYFQVRAGRLFCPHGF